MKTRALDPRERCSPRLLMTRRRFFQALAASVVVAGLPLPVRFPNEEKAGMDDHYIGGWLFFDGQSRKITEYNPLTRTVSMLTPA